jgi:hypothetical protein
MHESTRRGTSSRFSRVSAPAPGGGGTSVYTCGCKRTVYCRGKRRGVVRRDRTGSQAAALPTAQRIPRVLYRSAPIQQGLVWHPDLLVREPVETAVAQWSHERVQRVVAVRFLHAHRAHAHLPPRPQRICVAEVRARSGATHRARAARSSRALHCTALLHNRPTTPTVRSDRLWGPTVPGEPSRAAALRACVRSSRRRR